MSRKGYYEEHIFSCGLIKPPFKLGYGWTITSHCFTSTWSFDPCPNSKWRPLASYSIIRDMVIRRLIMILLKCQCWFLIGIFLRIVSLTHPFLGFVLIFKCMSFRNSGPVSSLIACRSEIHQLCKWIVQNELLTFQLLMSTSRFHFNTQIAPRFCEVLSVIFEWHHPVYKRKTISWECGENGKE